MVCAFHRAIEILKTMKRLNDDEVMLLIVKEFEKIGVTVLDQTIFIKNLMTIYFLYLL